MYIHEPGEEFWLHFDWAPQIMQYVKITTDATTGDVQLKKVVETDATKKGFCREGWSSTDYIGKYDIL